MLNVHAICRTTNQLEFDIEGLSEASRVYSIHNEGYCAVVSTALDLSLSDLDRKTALEHLLIHQRIVEAVMPHGALIPVKFGTVLPGESDVIQLIHQTQKLVEETLNEFDGKIQMEVSVSWDTSEVFLALSQMLSVIEMKKKAEEGDTKAKAELGAHVKQLMDEKRNAYTSKILPQLKHISEAVIVHPVMADEVVLNVALLINAEHENMLDEVLENIDEHYDGKLGIRCMGPMPLYSFTTLKATKVSPELVEQACQVLELPSPATVGGIKRAYRKKAQLLHPDLNESENEVLDNERMSELTAAYNLLSAFAESQLMNVKLVDGERCHFDKETVEKTLLVTFEKHIADQQEPVV